MLREHVGKKRILLNQGGMARASLLNHEENAVTNFLNGWRRLDSRPFGDRCNQRISAIPTTPLRCLRLLTNDNVC